MTNDEKRGPLDGSVSGTIGGGGRESGGPTERPDAPEMPKVKPENAASGRLAPDPLGATTEPDELGPGAKRRAVALIASSAKASAERSPKGTAKAVPYDV
jgi:hypothetical protein